MGAGREVGTFPGNKWQLVKVRHSTRLVLGRSLEVFAGHVSRGEGSCRIMREAVVDGTAGSGLVTVLMVAVYFPRRGT